MKKIRGIYKITSPSGKIYIGQSIDIFDRFRYYKGNYKSTRSQIRLHRSFLKYGIDNHGFEIIEECSVEILNEKERYYQDLYNATGEKGLNCTLTTTDTLSGKQSKETILKRSGENHFLFGKKHSELTKQKIKESRKGFTFSEETKKLLSILRTGESNPFYGKTHSQKSLEKMSKSAKNRNVSYENEKIRREKIKKAHKNVFKSENHKKNISLAKLGNKNPMYGKKGALHPNSKKLIQMDLDYNILNIWNSMIEVCNHYNYNYKNFSYNFTQQKYEEFKKVYDFYWKPV